MHGTELVEGVDSDTERRLKLPVRIIEIISAISKDGPLPYSELADRLLGTISENRVRTIVRKASSRKLLEGLTGDGDLPPGLIKGKASRVQYVQVGREAGCVVGVTIGRTYFAIGVADPNGRLFSTISLPKKGLKGAARDRAWEEYHRGQIVTHRREPSIYGRRLLTTVAKCVVARLRDLEVYDEEVRGVTVSVPAPVSATQGILLSHSIEARLAAVGDVEAAFASALRSAAGDSDSYLNLEKVVLANDADVAARGEVRYGEDAYRRKDVVVIHAAYGVGAGIVTNGNVLRNGVGGGVGEIGHCVPSIRRDQGVKHGLVPLDPSSDLYNCSCERLGHLEALAGGEAIVRRLAASQESFATDPPENLALLLADPNRSVATTLDALFEAVTAPRPWRPGVEALRDAGHMIGGAVHTLAHLFRPESVYVCGKLSEAAPLFIDAVKDGFELPGSLEGYEPEISSGDSTVGFRRRLIMVKGAAMTAVRATRPLISRADLEEFEEEGPGFVGSD
jgi:predicted NBD/HSP70 family sugar kinase